MPLSLQLSAHAAHQEQRAAGMVVDVGVGHRRSVHDQRLVEQVPVSVVRVLQLLQEVRKRGDVVAVDLGKVEDAFLAPSVVAGRVEGGRGTAFREDPWRRVPAELEREDPGRIGCEGEQLQVEHHLHVLAEVVRHAHGGLGQLPLLTGGVLLLDAADALLQLADVVDVLADAMLVGGPQFPLQAGDLAQHPVEDAAVGAQPMGPLLRGSAGSEELLEHRARIPHHRQRLAGRRPADRIRVGARVAVGAAARLVDVLDRELDRRDRGVLAEALDIELVQGGADLQIRALGLLRMRLGKEHRRGAEMVAADLLGRERVRHA